MSAPSLRARGLIVDAIPTLYHNGKIVPAVRALQEYIDELERTIAAAYARGFAEAREQAAKVADDRANCAYMVFPEVAREKGAAERKCALGIRDRIRALRPVKP